MTTPVKPIDTDRFAARLRARAIDVKCGRVLISRLTGSGQEVDLTLPTNCNGYGRIRHFRLATAEGWPANALPIAPACRALGISPVPQLMTALVFQNAACAWRCWYCFVPEDLLKADPNHSAWFTAPELVELYRQLADPPLIIDLSGGSPDLVPEWTLWMMRALQDAGLDRKTFLWTDDNLSTRTYSMSCQPRTWICCGPTAITVGSAASRALTRARSRSTPGLRQATTTVSSKSYAA
jgi:hypothetical protein